MVVVLAPFTLVNIPSKGKAGAEAIAQLTQFARQIAYAIFLSTDSIIWLQGAKVLQLDKE
jgi:hypothetical protein